MKRTMMIALISVLAVLIILTAAWFIRSSGKIKEYRDENGKLLEGSVSEKIRVRINGADNGLYINGRDEKNPVLLLISSGPGTDDYFLNEKYPDMHIDDIFTVVYWDYRGMGFVYDSEIDPADITEEVLMKDVREVTKYLKERFNQEKIYLMGFSGGTHIGLRAAAEYPEDYYAYIGMAQVVTDGIERDTIMYNFMKEVFTKRKDRKSLEKLNASVQLLEDGNVKADNWYSYVYLLHDAGGGTTYNESELWGITIPILMSRCYTVKEKFDYIRGMKMYRETAFENEKADYDYREIYTEFKIPIFFISGEYDYNCPWILVKDYCNKLDAPEKEFYSINGAAHSPLWENFEDSFEVMTQIKNRTYIK